MNELVEERSQELTTEELQELQSQQHSGVLQEIGFEEEPEVEFFFFFLNEIDARRYTGKVHPPKAWIGPSIVKKRRRGEFYGLGRS